MIDNQEHLSHELIEAVKGAIETRLEVDFADFFEFYKKENSDYPDLTEQDLIQDILDMSGVQQEDDPGFEDGVEMGAILISGDEFNHKKISSEMVEDAEDIIEQADFDLDFTELFELYKERNLDLGSVNQLNSPKIILEDSFKKPDFLKIILETGHYLFETEDDFYDSIIAGVSDLFRK